MVRVVPRSQLGVRDRGDVAHRLTLDRVARRVPKLRSGDGAETVDHAVDLSRGERGLLHEHRRECRRSFGRCREDEDVAGGIADAALGERLARGGDVTGRAVRPGVVVELAELGRQDPTAMQVVEAVGDRFARVQVALGQDVRAGGRGVRRRVAVGRRIPDEAVLSAAAGEVSLPLVVHIVDLGLSVKWPS